MSVVPTIEHRFAGSIRDAVSMPLAQQVPAVSTTALAAVPIVALGLAEGGYFPRPWGWAALGLALASTLLLLRRGPSLSRRPLIFLGLLGALGLWTAASLAWTRSPGSTVLELQRLLLYLAAIAAAAVAVRAHTARTLLGGVFLGTSALSIGGLVAYLLTRERAPDVLQGAYLHRPLGYANGMAIVSVIALVLALGIATDATSRGVRIAAATALVPLSYALALTGSRASVVALAVGLAAVVALATERRRLLVVWCWILVVPAIAVLGVSAFTPTDSGIVGAAGDELGDRLLVLLVALTALTVPPALLATRTGAAPRLGRFGRRQTPLGVVALACLVGLTVTRIPSLGGDRPRFWRVALEAFGDRPLLGSGAGTYAQLWLERRPVDLPVRDAHSIVVESLAELGLVGAVLVLVLLLVPLIWARRERTRPLVPAAGGAFAAYAVHASADWDWELPAVTLAGLFCAVAIGAAADADRAVVRPSPRARRLAVAVSVLAAAVALAGLVGATTLENARRSLARGDAVAAAREAGRSTRWQPWSIEGLLVEGQARLALGDRRGAGALFARAAAREPADYRAWLALAAVRPDVAQAAVRRARELNPYAVPDLGRGADDPRREER